MGERTPCTGEKAALYAEAFEDLYAASPYLSAVKKIQKMLGEVQDLMCGLTSPLSLREEQSASSPISATRVPSG